MFAFLFPFSDTVAQFSFAVQRLFLPLKGEKLSISLFSMTSCDLWEYFACDFMHSELSLCHLMALHFMTFGHTGNNIGRLLLRYFFVLFELQLEFGYV